MYEYEYVSVEAKKVTKKLTDTQFISLVHLPFLKTMLYFMVSFKFRSVIGEIIAHHSKIRLFKTFFYAEITTSDTDSVD